MNSHLDLALTLARERHSAQVDKAGVPYFAHLLRVAARVADDETAMIVALLHDIIEDTKTTRDDLLRLSFSLEVVDAVCLLTKDPALTYRANIEAIKTNALATRVKIADLEDNLDPSRFLPTEFEWMRERYKSALEFLRA